MARGKNGHLGHVMIDQDGDGIKPLGRRKSDDKVHGRSGERGGILGRDDRYEGDRGAIRLIFCGLANSTTINISKDKTTHSGPEELTANEVIGFISTGMSSSGGIME